jgi:hypothetical protein
MRSQSETSISSPAFDIRAVIGCGINWLLERSKEGRCEKRQKRIFFEKKNQKTFAGLG